MDLTRFLRADLLHVCKEFGIPISSTARKAQVVEAIQEAGLEDDDINETLKALDKRQQDEKEKEKQNRESQALELEKMKLEQMRETRAFELEKLKLELELRKEATNPSESRQSVSRAENVDMSRLLQPFKIGQDMGLFLVNFERACERERYSKETWPARLMTVIPCEAADSVARLSAEDAKQYDKVKQSLLKRFRLSAEAFRCRFRDGTGRNVSSFAERAFDIKANLREWLKSAEAFGNADKIVEVFALEQFFQEIPETVKNWVRDKSGVVTIESAADLADEYASLRGIDAKGATAPTRPSKPVLVNGRKREQRESANQETPKNSQAKGDQKGKEGQNDRQKVKAFEKKQPIVCHRCKEEGHIAVGCRIPRVAMAYESESDSEDLMKPYLYELKVNGRPCTVLRDSGASLDLVHPSFVSSENYLSKCVWIRQVMEEQTVCLPVAEVMLEVPFGELRTEAAVSDKLPKKYLYLLSNRTAHLMRKAGMNLEPETICALTRAKARELRELKAAEEAEEQKGMNDQGDRDHHVKTPTVRDHQSADDQEDIGSSRGEFLAPTSEALTNLIHVDRDTLIKLQGDDASLAILSRNDQVGVAKKNVRIFKKNDVLYRHYEDRKGRVVDQLIVPKSLRNDVLRLCHDNSWAGHLGSRKTKQRLLQEWYWPGCFRDVENYVRACDTCQRVGKPNERCKAPLTLVPIISEPFQRLVIDVVGPLPTSKSGSRYVLTMICPATKFPEAVPLKEQSSTEIVDGLLSVFSRVGFPKEIQCDNGSVFTSALTTTFLEKCGIRVIHSSLHHPQSNSVEKWHSVLKRVLRALTYECKTDWEAGLPGAMFALRSVPHEATGFSPAELVYGRALRSPMRLIREKWEDEQSDTTVIEYVLSLLERLRNSREIAESNMREAQQRAKTYYDRNARPRVYKEGDKVLVLRPTRANKLEVHWDGPFKVIRKLSDTTYMIEFKGRKKEVRTYHTNLMKPYLSSTHVVSVALNVPEEQPSDLVEWGDVKESSANIDEIVQTVLSNAKLSEQEKEDVKQLVQDFKDLFSDYPGRTALATHDIELTSESPVRSRPYRISPRQEEIMRKEIKRMLDLGVIEEGESEYASPMIIVEVAGKEPRPCIDYRKLNAVTKTQAYPIPNVEERVERVSRARFITTLDLVRGYWQVPMSERAQQFAAFTTPFGSYRPLMLSFGLKNAPFCFSKLMSQVLRGAEGYAVPYLDDIAFFSDSWQDHLEHLRDVFNRLQTAGLTLKASKCHLAQAEVLYLGHRVGQGKRTPAEMKIAAIADFPRPQSKSEVRAFLGLTGYYRSYIRQYSEIASPLTDSLRKQAPNKVNWNDEKESAFQRLKAALTKPPVLRSPDFTKPFIVQCDASNRGMGVILSQKDNDDQEHPILYASRKLSIREEAYSATEKECACLVWATQKLSCYLYGAEFVFETDHCPLTWLNQMSSKNSRLLRWSLALQQYNFNVRYKKGKTHVNADCLSRA
ncbi:uncharacterized protein LOC135395680 [Ornithodoros turicata]|uniref:uncharacterized protein LOC135395680 n=1 Tax=Ornithodoros turicata TaxID=34597 RepID=UPI003138704D